MTSKYQCVCADHRAEFKELAAVVRKGYNANYTTMRRANDYSTVPHSWHLGLQNKFDVHPVVLAMLEAHRPACMVDLMFEWPHVSEKDPAMLAYTRDDAKGETDVQTLTSIGKYVARHWPKVPDHVRRDACLLYTPEQMHMVEATTEAIIHAIQNGPSSCMKGGWDVHPYSVYTPELGWGMAVRLNGEGHIDGRALTWTDPYDEKRKVFARTYARNKEHGGYSYADQVLAAWLEAQGFEHTNWPEGARLAKLTNRHDEPLLPYIDGDNQHVRSSRYGGNDCWAICDGDTDAEYKCDNTNGTADEVEDNSNTCEDCDDRMSYDDSYNVGRHEDRCVCESCRDNDYTYVTGVGRSSWGSAGRRYEYYVRNDDAVEVGGSDYDSENLPDNIVQLNDGDYADIDDCCCVDGEWYLSEDCVCCADGEWRLSEECTECADDGEFYPSDDCWECTHSGESYSDKVEFVMLDGDTYHPDSVAEMRAETQVAPLLEAATA